MNKQARIAELKAELAELEGVAKRAANWSDWQDIMHDLLDDKGGYA